MAYVEIRKRAAERLPHSDARDLLESLAVACKAQSEELEDFLVGCGRLRMRTEGASYPSYAFFDRHVRVERPHVEIEKQPKREEIPTP